MFSQPCVYQRAAGLGILAALLHTCWLRAADDRTYSQKPVVASAQLRGEQKAAPPVKPKPQPGFLSKGPAPFWIWGADQNQRYYLRKEFAGGSTAARLIATCDNRMTIFLNDQEIASSSEWQSPVEVDVQKFLKPDKNVLLVEVENQGGQAGFILKLGMTPEKGDARYVVTDETWTAAGKKDSDRWLGARQLARLGAQPWGNVFSQERVTSGASVPSNVFQLLPGFQVERLFTVPKDKLGSWVSITFDDKGRLLTSDQDGKGLCRITLPRIGTDEPTRVEHLDVKITAAQGMLYAFGSLYLSVNGGPGSGLYRMRDTNGDDQFDSVVKLKSLRGGGEHGPHGLRLSQDGKSILVACGNHTDPPEVIDSSRVPRNWAEDLLLPRQWDANGHARGRMAPGGWIARTDPDGKTWEMVSVGYRNEYDFALNAEGEMFAYDSDMEWDMGSPWYRPTRVTHAVSGSEFGWRSGTGKWPQYYVDSLPPLLDIGPGSPVGVEFGHGTKFPAKYQKALYICDWTFGTIYALHLEPDGSTYKATKEEFLSRTPLPLTDIAVGPDGALYFAIGGRGTQSELFRVTYVGKEATATVDYRSSENADLRKLRRELEQYHAPAADQAKAVDYVIPNIGFPDRFIRYAARVALEHQKPSLWQDRVIAAKEPEALITGAVALARQGDKALQPNLLTALDRLDFASLTEFQQLELLRVYALVFMRMGEPDKDTTSRLVKKLDAFFPAKTHSLNRELANLLVYLKSPTILGKCIAMMQQESQQTEADRMEELLARNRGYGSTIARVLANSADLQKLHYAFVLRNVREGWTPELRKYYFQWLNDARQRSGGSSYQGFINNIEKDAFDNATDADRLAIEASGLRKPFRVKELPKAQGPGKEWKLDELVKFAEPRLKARNFKNGQKMYAAARCVICHRFNGEGGATGPDLSQVAGRFTLKDLGESIVEPSKVVSDQYRASMVTTRQGKVINGKIVSETKDSVLILTDPEDSTKVVEVKKGEVDEVKHSPISLMPQDLLKTLNGEEVLDLIAYLLSRGEPNHPMFRK